MKLRSGAAQLSRRQLIDAGARGQRPPWALDEARFTDTCTRCGECLSACLEAILRPGSGGFTVVANEAHREFSERIWNLPAGTIPPKPGYHAVLQNRMLKDGKLNASWVMCNNNMQAAPNMNEAACPGYRNPDNSIAVSEPYPTVTAMSADLMLPTAMWAEKEGVYGNAERRTQFWRQQVAPLGKARSDLWQLMEFAKRFKAEDVWPDEFFAKKPEHRRKTLFGVLFANSVVNRYPAQWPHKMVRKVQATNELWHTALGTIDTSEKFETRRLEVAQHVWASMKETDSHECRNCHDFGSMDYAAQGQRAVAQHIRASDENRTCIDCHKGIAHSLPDMHEVDSSTVVGEVAPAN